MPVRYPKCFVSGSFSPDDRMVFDWFAELLRALEFEVVTGVDPEPVAPSEKIRERIRTSDAMVAVLTRRTKISDTEQWKGPEWVHSEVGMAYDAEKPVAVFVEEGVDVSGLAPTIADYIRFNRDDLGSAAPSVVRYLLSVRNLVTQLPLLKEDTALIRGLTMELLEFTYQIEAADQDWEIVRWPVSYYYGNISGRLFMLPGNLQNSVQEAYDAVDSFKEYLAIMRRDAKPPLFGKEKPKAKEERDSRFKSNMGRYKGEKEKVLGAISQGLMKLLQVGIPELGELLSQLPKKEASG